jgi:MFS family permease
VRGRYGSYLQSGSAFARFFASMMGNYFAVKWLGWRGAFIVSAVPALMVVLIRRQMPESDVWLQSVKAGVSSRLGYVAALGQMVGPALRKTTALALTVTTFNMAAYWFKTIWLPTYLTTRGLTPGAVAWLLLMDQIGSIGGYVAFGFCSDFLGRRPSFTIFSVIKAVGLLMVTLGWTLAGGNTWTTYGFMLLVGFGEGNWGCIGPLLNEVFPTNVRAATLGIIYNTARGVQFFAPVVIGFVAARSSFGAGIALAVPFALLAGASVWLLPETKGVRLMSDALRYTTLNAKLAESAK